MVKDGHIVESNGDTRKVDLNSMLDCQILSEYAFNVELEDGVGLTLTHNAERLAELIDDSLKSYNVLTVDADRIPQYYLHDRVTIPNGLIDASALIKNYKNNGLRAYPIHHYYPGRKIVRLKVVMFTKDYSSNNDEGIVLLDTPGSSVITKIIGFNKEIFASTLYDNVFNLVVNALYHVENYPSNGIEKMYISQDNTSIISSNFLNVIVPVMVEDPDDKFFKLKKYTDLDQEEQHTVLNVLRMFNDDESSANYAKKLKLQTEE